VIRSRILVHMASAVDAELEAPVHALTLAVSRRAPGVDSAQPVRDLDQIRSFLSGPGLTALFDLPWMLLFIGVLFLLHPALGVTVLLGGIALIGLTLLTDRVTRAAAARLLDLARDRQQLIDTSRRHVDALHAMGMEGRQERRWAECNRRYLAAHVRLAGSTGTLTSVGKIFRLFLQSLVLTVGAYLVIGDRASGGIIFASSILSSRALAPIELAIANWRGFVGARGSWARLKLAFDQMGAPSPRTLLPPPEMALTLDNLTLAPAGESKPIVHNVSLHTLAGQAIAVLGPSGAGKSTLLRGIAGILPAAAGTVRLDGATLDQWPRDTLGRHIGYLPQNVELLTGSVAENIARFEPDAPHELILMAAHLAGVHDMIQHLPDGYNSQVGQDGRALSAGQRQRIALARAMYRDPFLLLLDEPNSNLDESGEDALVTAVRAATARGAIVLVIAHRPAILAAIDLVLLMRDGRAEAFDRVERLVPHLLPGSAGVDRVQRAGPVGFVPQRA
jgi:PrtD family type I secretion system ABC transporter